MTRIIKFRAWCSGKNGSITFSKPFMDYKVMIGENGGYLSVEGGWDIHGEIMEVPIMQFTGLTDKNGVAEIYEGDIIDSEGNIKGNIYESPQIYKEGADCLIAGMGTKEWRNTESVAMGRGCKYAE